MAGNGDSDSEGIRGPFPYSAGTGNREIRVGNAVEFPVRPGNAGETGPRSAANREIGDSDCPMRTPSAGRERRLGGGLPLAARCLAIGDQLRRHFGPGYLLARRPPCRTTRLTPAGLEKFVFLPVRNSVQTGHYSSEVLRSQLLVRRRLGGELPCELAS